MQITELNGDNGDQTLYHQVASALGAILADAQPGEFLPSEPALAQQLGISRATLREAMRTFENQGMIVRKQGIGTYVTSPPPVIETGLEVLESIETIGNRMGLKVEMSSLSVREYLPKPHEASVFEIPEDEKLVEISRVLHVDDRPAAFLVDILPCALMSFDFSRNGFTGSVLDLLLEVGEPEPVHSRTEITAVSASDGLASLLDVRRGTGLLKLEALLYGHNGRAIDHSLSFFLPGVFQFHVLRKVKP